MKLLQNKANILGKQGALKPDRSNRAQASEKEKDLL